MNNFRKFATASVLTVMGAIAVSGNAFAADQDENPAPSAAAAVENDPLLHSTPPSLLSKVPAVTTYRVMPPQSFRAAPSAPKPRPVQSPGTTS